MIQIRLRTGSMPTLDLVSPNAIIPALKVNGKKQALQEIAAKAAALTGQSDRAILEILLQREKLGSTGVGNGVAIPHGKLARLDRIFGLFARAPKAIDFEALDEQPVDRAIRHRDVPFVAIPRPRSRREPGTGSRESADCRIAGFDIR